MVKDCAYQIQLLALNDRVLHNSANSLSHLRVSVLKRQIVNKYSVKLKLLLS